MYVDNEDWERGNGAFVVLTVMILRETKIMIYES